LSGVKTDENRPDCVHLDRMPPWCAYCSPDRHAEWRRSAALHCQNRPGGCGRIDCGRARRATAAAQDDTAPRPHVRGLDSMRQFVDAAVRHSSAIREWIDRLQELDVTV